MDTARRSHNPRSAAVSAEDQPQRPGIPAGTRWHQQPPLGPTCCGWCSAHTAVLREESSRRTRILQSCSTEENNSRHRSRKSPSSEPISAGEFLVSSVLQLFKILARREDFAVALPISRAPENCLGRRAFGPGGTPQEISRGQARASGRGPRLPRQTGHAPAGHRRSFWRRPPRTVSATTRRLGPVGPPASDQHSGPFLRYPAGARSDPERFPGAASAGADLPPANLLRCPSGTGTGCSPTDQGKPLARD